MISIVLVNPITPGNIGAVARVMKNFGLDSLILVDPKCSHLDKEAIDRASHAKDILKRAKRMGFPDVVRKSDYVIGTTSKLGTDYNIPRCPLNPEQAAEKINEMGSRKIAILFGNESYGLTNKEINECDFIIAVPTSRKYPAMNLSHSAAVILYSIYMKRGKQKITRGIWPITGKEKRQIEKMVGDILDRMEFDTKERKETQRKLWKRLVGKSLMTRREAYALMGFLKKVKDKKIR